MIGFALTVNASEAELELYGPSQNGAAPMVSFSRCGEHLAALLGRLRYRKDVLATLERGAIPEGLVEEAERNDAALALAAYLHHGVAGLTRLEGDFAVAVWDGRARRLLGRRDPLGGYPLFWARGPQSIAFATSPLPLLELLPGRSFDLSYLAQFVLSGSRGELPTEASAYEGVARVLPETVVTADAGTGAVERRVYWDWLEGSVDRQTASLDELALELKVLLTEAIAQSLSGVAATHCSGGMDSTSVCCLALDLVRSGVGTSPLHALSLVYERLPDLAKERPYIERFLLGREDLVGHRVEGDDLLHFDSFSDPPFHDEPYSGLWSLASEAALIRAASACGASALLTGRGADELMLGEPHHLIDLVRKGRIVRAWSEACRWAEGWDSTPSRILRNYVWNTLRTGAVEGVGRALLRRRSAGLRRQDDFSVPPWISPAFARRHDLRDRGAENARRAFSRTVSTPLSVALHNLDCRVGEAPRWMVAAPVGVSLAQPFLDPRVVRFGLGVQSRLALEPGTNKPILSEAVRGVLPEDIRNRRDKRPFNEVYYVGLRRNLGRLEALVREAPIDDLGMVDKETLVGCLHDAAMGVAGPGECQGLNVTLSLLQWLTMQSQEQPRPVPSLQVTGALAE